MSGQVNLSIGTSGLTLTIGDSEAYFNNFWLRDNCPSAADPETGEKVFDIVELEDTPTVESADLDGDHLIVTWADGHVSRYTLSDLLTFGADGIPDVAAISRRLWETDQYDHFPRISQPALDTEDKERNRLARALIEDGIAIVTDMENSDAGLTRLANALGQVTPSTDGSYFDVRLHIDPTNLAFTAKALEMHTDLPCEQLAPGIQFLHCRANSVDGGLSMFVDGAAVAEAFRQSNPDDFALLSNHDIPFRRNHRGHDTRAHQRVIELDRNGAVSGLTISQHLVDRIDLPQKLLDTYYPALCRFLRLVRSDRFMNRFRLSAGECIVFDNHRIVHGREAFVAESGERHLRGCYIDRGELRSTLRVLSR